MGYREQVHWTGNQGKLETTHKRSCIKAQFSSLHTHCCSPVARKAEQAYLYKILQSNGYPINFIIQATRPARGTTTTSNEPENAAPTIWRLLPYIQGISDSVARRLNPYNVKIAHKPHSALRSNLIHVKDPVPTLQRHKVIYQIPCSGCDKTYTGQTGRLLGTRLKEHLGSVRWHDTNSCLALHCVDTGHAKRSKPYIRENTA